MPFYVFEYCAKRPSAGSLATCTSSCTERERERERKREALTDTASTTAFVTVFAFCRSLRSIHNNSNYHCKNEKPRFFIVGIRILSNPFYR